MHDVVVIGAGMAGTAAAREIARAGGSVVVVEARDRVGGRLHSVRDFCGQPVEGGAEFIHGVGAEHWDVARAAGVRTRALRATHGAMFDIGQGPRWLPLVLLDPRVWPCFRLLWLIRHHRPPDLSAGQFIERHGFRGPARVLAKLTLTAHLPGSLDEVGIMGLLEDRVLDLETGLNHRVVEGYDTLPRFLARDLDVRLGFDIETVRWDPGGVSVTSRDGRELAARAAISTLPVGVLAAGRVRFVPDLPAAKRDALGWIRMGPVQAPAAVPPALLAAATRDARLRVGP
jgi:monoamine oxidase